MYKRIGKENKPNLCQQQRHVQSLFSTANRPRPSPNSKDCSLLDHRKPSFSQPASPPRRPRSSTPQPRISRSKTPLVTMRAQPTDKKLKCTKTRLKKNIPKAKKQKPKIKQKVKQKLKVKKPSKKNFRIQDQVVKKMPKITFDSIIMSNSQETGQIYLPPSIQHQNLCKQSQLIMINQIRKTQRQMSNVVIAAVTIQRWWRNILQQRNAQRPSLHHSPRVLCFKSSNLSNFSSARQSSDDIRSCQRSTPISQKNSDQLILEVLKIAQNCSKQQGQFNLSKFKLHLCAAFKSPSPRRPAQPTPHQSGQVNSLIGSINKDLQQLKLHKIQDRQDSSRINRLFKKDTQNNTPRRPLQDTLSARRSPLNNSTQLTTNSKQLKIPRQIQFEGTAPRRLRDDCLFTFEVFDEQKDGLNLSLQSSIAKNMLGSKQSIKDSIQLLLPTPRQQQQTDQITDVLLANLLLQVQRQLSLIINKKKNQPRNNLAQSYLGGLIQYALQRFSVQLDLNLQKIIGVPPHIQLRYLRSQDYDYDTLLQDQNQFVISAAFDNSVFLDYQKKNSNQKISIYRQCLQKAIFDSFNDALDYQRPYGYSRKIPPWGQVTLRTGRSQKMPNRSIKKKMERARDKVLIWFGEDGTDQDQPDQQGWLRMVDDGLQVRLQLTDTLTNQLLQEVVSMLIAF